MQGRKIGFEYEPEKIPYVLEKTYTPDFVLDNGIVIEFKGHLTQANRTTMRAVRDQHPHLDIRFVFQRASNRLSKTSQTTYAEWAEKNGFKWAEGVVPTKWAKEKLND